MNKKQMQVTTGQDSKGSALQTMPAPEPNPQTEAAGLTRILSDFSRLASCERGAVVRRVDAGRTDILAIFPEETDLSTYPEWTKPYASILADALKDRGGAAQQGVTRWIRQPDAGVQGAVWRPAGMDRPWAFVFEAPARDAGMRERLTLAMQSFSDYMALMTAQHNEVVIKRLTQVITILSVINRPRRFLSAAMSMCNEMVAEWGCERVSLGILRGRYVRLRATSHQAKFSRKMKIVQDIEATMEECLDQDVEVLHPAVNEVPTIRRAASQLAAHYGASAVLSVPLRIDNKPKAVLTMEWPADKLPDTETVTTVRLACNLSAPRLLNLYRQDRWLITKMFLRTGDALGVVFGPRHIGAKAAALALVGLIVFMVVGKGTYRAQSPFVVEAEVQQSIVAPYDGFIKEVFVEIDDKVSGEGRTTLATLDTAELSLELGAARAERFGFLKQVDAYEQQAQYAQAQMAQAEADRVQAQIDLLEYRIKLANVTSPIAGTITKGDLKRHLKAPVKTGDIMFEVTPLESLRSVLLVSEERIHELAVGQKGSLATASYPDRHIDFEVELIYPTAEVVNQRNVFRVRARFETDELPPWLRPGMEGIAKVDIGKRRWIYIWSRKFVNWVRMTLWI